MSKSRPRNRLNGQIRAEATEWLIQFSDGEVDARSREEFNDWLRASPEHVRAYLRISAFWQEAGRIAGKEELRDIDALVRLAQSEATVFPLEPTHAPAHPPGAQAGSPRRPAWRLAPALAAVLLVFGVAAAAWHALYHASIYATGIGEQRTVNLPDGSTVLINAQSSINLRFTETERAIELREGQAFFKVAKNAARPFIVHSGGASIKALGTQFDVYRKEAGTIVTVVEGKVAVEQEKAAGAFSLPFPEWVEGLQARAPRGRDGGGSPVREAGKAGDERPGPELFLSSGEQAVVTSRAARRQPVSRPEAATAWTQGLLIFEGAPLSEVVREFNRQNVKPLVISDAQLSGLEISGTFPASGAGRIVRFLKERFHVTVDETNEEIRISGS